MSGLIDGNWIDICSLVLAIAYAIWKSKRMKRKFVAKTTAIDLANGCSIFPLLVLGFAALSSRLLQELMQANKLILSVAGFCALLAMLEDDF